MTILDSLKVECTKRVEMWSGDVVAPLQCGYCDNEYFILEWNDIRRDYDKWITDISPVNVLLRYFRAKCFEGELLNCDNFFDQCYTFIDMVHDGELSC